jgi:uncharacterized protein (TIGR00251 family)
VSGLPSFVARSPDGTVLSVFVQPRAAKDAIVGVHGDALKLKLKAPPLDDRANRSVCSFVASLLGISAGDVSLVTGRSSRHKKVSIPLSPEVVAEALAPYLTGGPKVPS